MDISPDKQNIDSVFSNTTWLHRFLKDTQMENEEPVKDY